MPESGLVSPIEGLSRANSVHVQRTSAAQPHSHTASGSGTPVTVPPPAGSGALPGTPQVSSTLNNLRQVSRRLAHLAEPADDNPVDRDRSAGDKPMVLQPVDVQQAFTNFQTVQTVAGMVQSILQGTKAMSDDACGQINPTVNAISS
jgi:hypothetical protein